MKQFLTTVVIAGLIALSLSVPVLAAKKKTHQVGVTGSWPMRLEWAPSTLEIAVGDKVVWDVAGGGHNVTPYEGPWPSTEALTVDATGAFSFRFKKPGTYRYLCSSFLHSQLVGATCFGQCGVITVR